jgi:pimeloyl-ACP methyl ester carboxylesterase
MLSVGRDLFENPSTITLPDGRTLGYAETGDADGEPIVALHGIPSGRLGAAIFDQVAREHGIRIIAPERPGVGVSDPDPDRELVDWPADVSDLLDILDI